MVGPTLSMYDRGRAVRQLQSRLAVFNDYRCRLDGVYGSATFAAVRSAQHRFDLAETGVANRSLFRALSINPWHYLSRLMPSQLRPLFPQTPIKNIKVHLPSILLALSEQCLLDLDMCLLALAIIRAESESFVPLDEPVSADNTDPGNSIFNRYDRSQVLGNRGPPDGLTYRGRGFTRLTGRMHYESVSQSLGLGGLLVSRPHYVNRPHMAADVLVLSLKRKESSLRHLIKRRDYRRARVLVNSREEGMDRFLFVIEEGQVVLR